MRVLCVPIAERGHVNPMAPTLRRLVELGHDVIVGSDADIRTWLPANITMHTMTATSAHPRIGRGAPFAALLRDPAQLSSWVEQLLIDGVDAQLPQVQDAIASVRPDVVVADPMHYATVIACQQAKLPWVALSSSLNPVTPDDWSAPLLTTLSRLHHRRTALFTSRGLDVPVFRVADAISPWLTIAFTTPRYAGGIAGVELVGAPFDDRDLDVSTATMPDPPTAYVSFGSQAFHQPALFERVFACCQQRGWRIIASVGDLVDDQAFVANAPPNAVLHRYAPQLDILPHVEVVVTHGGANSVVESLWFGKPMVMLPLCNDQPLQARFAQRAGVAVVVDASGGDVDPHELECAFNDVHRCAPAAAAMAIELRQAGGPDRAAKLVAKLGNA
jgi:zeaxanthin glucosyltransferase